MTTIKYILMDRITFLVYIKKDILYPWDYY
jgi:hypothetical protein